MKSSVTVRVPGKVMLAGEYSVLKGETALAVTVDQHLFVRLQDRMADGRCLVASNLWPAARSVGLEDQANPDPLVAAVARGMALYHVQDVALRIDSELDVRHGLGSSSALRLGVLLAMEDVARSRAGKPAERPRAELWDIGREAVLLQRQAQAQASGYDVAIQLAGGMALIKPDLSSAGPAAARDWPGDFTPLPHAALNELGKVAHLFVGGAGAPTTSVMQTTLAWTSARPSPKP